MTKGNKWFTKRNTENKQNIINVNLTNMWGALGFFRNEKQFLIH